jgi:hypothetical protein
MIGKEKTDKTKPMDILYQFRNASRLRAERKGYIDFVKQLLVHKMKNIISYG